MTEFKDSGIKWIDKIPKTWKLKKIKYILNNRTENNNPIKSRDILSLTAKQGVVPLSEKESGGNKPKEDYSAYRLAYPNDIVMNSMNILSGSVGLSKYFGCVSPVYYMLYPISDTDDIRFYHYVFQTKMFQKSLLGLGNGIVMKESGNGKLNTIRMRIPIDKLGNLYIPTTSLIEQKKISDFLDKQCSLIDSISTKIQEQINILEEYKKSIISEAVTKGLNQVVKMKYSGIDYIGDMNSAWKLTRIGYICNKLYRPFSQESTALICSNHGEVFERGDKSFGLTSDNNSAYQGVKNGDLLIHGMDTWHGAIAVSELDGKCTTVVHVCDSKENKYFIAYYLKMLAFKKVYKVISNGVRGNTSDFRSWDKTSKIYITLPKIEEQNLIANYLNKKCAEIKLTIIQKQQQIETLEEYKKSLIYEYVTGKKEVI